MEGEGRFETCPCYGEGVECRGCGKDGSPHARGRRGLVKFNPKVCAWVPACARTTGGERWFASCPYVGITEHDVDGQPQGLALRRRGQAIRGKNGGRDGSPHPRGQGEGESGSRTRPYVGVAEQGVDGQPQGLALRRRGCVPAFVGKTDREGVHEGRPYEDGGRLFAGTAEGGMGPRMREDTGRGKVVRELPLRGNHRTRRRRATTRVARTETGGSYSREKRGEGWVPACARTTAISRISRRRPRMGPRMREDDGRGKAVRELPLRRRGCVGEDGSPHARGHGGIRLDSF